jgi:hypothetical protein
VRVFMLVDMQIVCVGIKASRDEIEDRRSQAVRA